MDEANNGDSATRPSAGPQGSYMYQAQASENAGSGMYAAANAYAQQHFAQNHVLQEQLKKFWAEMMEDVQGVGTDPAEFKSQQLPLARIKKIMKSDEDVRMISAEAPVLFAKACEFFILEMTLRAWNAAEEHKRRTLQRSDIATAISRTVVWDFLLDTVPVEGDSGAVAPTPIAGPGMPSSLGVQPTEQATTTQPQGTTSIAAAMPGVPPSLNVYHQGQPFFQSLSGPLPPPQGPLPPQGTQYRQPGLVAPSGMSMPGLMYPPPGLFFPQQPSHPPGYGQTIMGGAVAMPSGTLQMPGHYPTNATPPNAAETQNDAAVEKPPNPQN